MVINYDHFVACDLLQFAKMSSFRCINTTDFWDNNFPVECALYLGNHLLSLSILVHKKVVDCCTFGLISFS